MVLSPRQIAEQGTILVREVGSSVHGTNLEGVDDLDLMGVCLQPADYLLGLQHFEQFIYRTARERAKWEEPSDQRKSGQEPPSEPGDTDLVIYSVQKYLRLALGGNPSILVLLYSPKRHREFEIHPYESDWDEWAESFIGLADKLASKQAGVKFLGYLRAQKERMLGTRGQMRVTRQELLDVYGYDTKYAMQALRLGYQGIEFMNEGKLTLPLHPSIAEELKQVRIGAWHFSHIISWIDELEEQLKRAIDNTTLPRHPDHKAVDKWLVKTHLEFFQWRQEQRNQAIESTVKLP